MTDKTTAERETPPAEKWLRDRYGAYRGHPSWRDLEEAFMAGRASLPLPGAQEAVAWAMFADNGNIRLWSKKPIPHPDAIPLLAAPQSALSAQAISAEPAEHVQNPAENEHVADDMSKNETGSNTAYAALERLERANETLCKLRTREQYLSMIESGQKDALLELDDARLFARNTLSASHGQAPAGASHEQALEEALRERDEADDFIDTLLDEVLGPDRAEWSSAYGRAEAMEEVRERITALHKPAVDRAWKQFAAADSVQEDAARYRWLREGNDAKHGAAWHVAVNLYGCEWDAAIDSARKQG